MCDLKVSKSEIDLWGIPHWGIQCFRMFHNYLTFGVSSLNLKIHKDKYLRGAHYRDNLEKDYEAGGVYQHGLLEEKKKKRRNNE